MKLAIPGYHKFAGETFLKEKGMKSTRWVLFLFIFVMLGSGGCAVFKHNDCGCPTMNKKSMH